MIRRWIVSWLSQPLLDLIRDEIDLYLADIEASLYQVMEPDCSMIGPAGSGAEAWKTQPEPLI